MPLNPGRLSQGTFLLLQLTLKTHFTIRQNSYRETTDLVFKLFEVHLKLPTMAAASFILSSFYKFQQVHFQGPQPG